MNTPVFLPGKIPQTEPDKLQSMWSQRVKHNKKKKKEKQIKKKERKRKKESDTTEQLNTHTHYEL